MAGKFENRGCPPDPNDRAGPQEADAYDGQIAVESYRPQLAGQAETMDRRPGDEERCVRSPFYSSQPLPPRVGRFGQRRPVAGTDQFHLRKVSAPAPCWKGGGRTGYASGSSSAASAAVAESKATSSEAATKLTSEPWTRTQA